MTALEITEFQVLNYRNIEDSGWIPVERVSAFVGRNESGKTALLKALHKFNPATPEPYIAQKEFPRERFASETDKIDSTPVCKVRYKISADFREELKKLSENFEPPEHVVGTRCYKGDISLAFEPELPKQIVPGAGLKTALSELAGGARRLKPENAEQEEELKPLRASLAAWATDLHDKPIEELDLRSGKGKKLLAHVRTEVEKQSNPFTADLIEQFQAAIGGLVRKTEEPSIHELITTSVREKLPVFIYFENYGILDSAVYFPRFLQDLEKDPTDARVRTVNAMFRHVGLAAAEIAELGKSEARAAEVAGETVTTTMIRKDKERIELRATKLNSASIDITQKFSKWWQQRRHKVRYDVDGDYFRIWISDDRRPDVEIELEERSKGFQWFFSFYLVFLVESEEGHKDAVLLLDEPGLHLHPTAQQELISFFETLAERNQIFYSTHSPFLIDGEHLHRTRPVTETETGHSKVSIGTWPEDRETIFPLQAAAGYAMLRGLFAHRKNVLVEGLGDFYYLHALSIICRALDKAALPNDVYVTPCGGSKHVSQMSSLFLGEKVRPLVILDADDEGRARQDALLQHLYAGANEGILMISDVLGRENCEIEDLIGEETIVPIVNELTGSDLSLSDADKDKSLPDRISNAAAAAGVELPKWWKGEVARRLAINWSTTEPKDIPTDLVQRAEKLFVAITDRLAKIDQA